MQYTFKEFSFEAAHQTPPYSGLHGHSFRVRLILTGDPDPVYGWTHNLYEVDPLVETLRKELDGRYLNEIEGLSVPSLENVARWIWERLEPSLSGLAQVTVCRGADGHAEGAAYLGSGGPRGAPGMLP